MPGIQPIVKKIDELIMESITDLQYAIKWGNAYYGSIDLGWLIEVAAYDVSVNIVFLNGAGFNPRPPLGNGGPSRYIKIRITDELNDDKVLDYIKQARQFIGWK